MIRAVITFALVAGALGLHARASQIDLAPRLNALEQKLVAEAATDSLTDSSLLAASLVAGGARTHEELQRYLQRFDEIYRRLEGVPLHPTSQFQGHPDAALAYTIHRFLHEHVLTGKYRADCHCVQETLDAGDYNCVTATILFRCLADRCHLPVVTLATARHVFCKTQGNQPFYIELTTENSAAAIWTEAIALASATESERLAASRVRAPMQELSPSQIVAKVYYNRAVAALEQQDFEWAVSSLRTALCFNPDDETVMQNLLAGINNWALAECDAGNFGRAVALLDSGRRLSADYAPLATNDLHIHQQWTMQLCRAGHFSEALNILERGYQRRPDAPLFAEGRLIVWQAWISSLADRKKDDEAVVILQRALQQFPEAPCLMRLRADLTRP